MSGHFHAGGVRIDAVGLDAAAREIVERAAGPRCTSVHLCNAYTVSLARDEGFRSCLNAGDLNFADGMPLVWIGRRHGFKEITERVYGPDLMLKAMTIGLPLGLKHYLYGSTPSVLASLTDRLTKLVPGVTIVGTRSPPFGDDMHLDRGDFITEIRAVAPNIVWVGLGTPKQDRFVESVKGEVGVVLVAVGAAFDFHSGNKRQAPDWMKRSGLEWAFRAASEPRRLWRRYLIGNATFVRLALADEIRDIFRRRDSGQKS